MKPVNPDQQKAQTQKTKTAISPTRAERLSEWYQQSSKPPISGDFRRARLHDYETLGLCYLGNMQRVLDEKIKATAPKCLFSLIDSVSFLEKEAAHIDGLRGMRGSHSHPIGERYRSKLIPGSPLEDPYIIRPTSEPSLVKRFPAGCSLIAIAITRQSMGQHHALEMRTRMFFAYLGIFMARRPHCACHSARSANGNVRHPRSLRQFAEDYLAMLSSKVKIRGRTFSGRRCYLYHRSHDAR